MNKDAHYICCKQMTIVICLFVALSIYSYSKESSSTNINPNNSDVSDELHLSFYTPDWNAYINCDQLQLDARSSNLLKAASA